MTAVSDGMPPLFSAMPMAIGVVTDFGCKVAIRASSAPITLPMMITLTIPTIAPTKTEVRIDTTFPFRYLICSNRT